jgi:hypothetical protein
MGRPTTLPREAITVDLPMDLVRNHFPEEYIKSDNTGGY